MCELSCTNPPSHQGFTRMSPLSHGSRKKVLSGTSLKKPAKVQKQEINSGSKELSRALNTMAKVVREAHQVEWQIGQTGEKRHPLMPRLS